MFKAFAAHYCHADALVTIALFALIYFAWRSATVDLAGFGESFAAILTGRGLHAAGRGWGEGQTQP